MEYSRKDPVILAECLVKVIKENKIEDNNLYYILADYVLKTWEDLNPHNAMELVDTISREDIGKDNTKLFLEITTNLLLEKCFDFWNEVKTNTAGHCYINSLIKNNMNYLIPKTIDS